MSSAPPPPPQLSADGKYYWDGGRWLPTEGSPAQPAAGAQPGATRPPNTAALIVTGSVLGVVLIAVLIWYFGFYDTAAGKCNRGDLGACVVAAAQQAAANATAEAQQAAATASAEASASASAQQQHEDEVNRLNAAMASGCTVVSDPNHNMRLTYIGSNSAANCASAKNQGWVDANRVSGATIVCASSTLVVEDTGGRVLGRDLCQQLHLDIWP